MSAWAQAGTHYRDVPEVDVRSGCGTYVHTGIYIFHLVCMREQHQYHNNGDASHARTSSLSGSK